MFAIRAAGNGEFNKARAFYHSLIDAMEGSEFHPRWKKGVYPSDDFLLASIKRGELYLGFSGDETAAAMVINDEGAEGYENTPWLAKASCGKYFVIHALGVHPAHKGRGFARELVRKAAETARRRGMHALRLDVLSGNVPAIRLYESESFRYISKMNLFYEDTGVAEFLLYELA